MIKSVPGLKTTAIKSDAQRALLALALASAFLAGATFLLGHGLKSTLPMAASLEMQLSGALRTQSRSRPGGMKGGAINYAARLARLAGSSAR